MSRSSHFQRSQSKVWFGNEPDDPAIASGGFGFGGIIGGAFSGFRPYHHQHQNQSHQPPFHHGFGSGATRTAPAYPSFHDLEEEDELIEEEEEEQQQQQQHHQKERQKQQQDRGLNHEAKQQTADKHHRSANDWAEANRQGSPASHKSQDSGFSDTETSPPANGNASVSLNDDSATPKRTTVALLEERSPFQRSPSLNSGAPTPPTVIRRPMPPREPEETKDPPSSGGRRLSFDDAPASNGEGRAMGEVVVRSGGSISLKRGRVITKNSRVKRNLNDVLSHSSEEMISLDGSELNEKIDQGELASGSFSSESSPKSSADGNNNLKQEHTAEEEEDTFKREGRELPTYAQLYPAGTSTPIRQQAKLYRSLPLSPTHRRSQPIAKAENGVSIAENFYDEPQDMSTSSGEHGFSYTIYDNPLLNGHTPAVQGWLDGLRFSCHNEVMSILQTKSIASEVAGRTVRMTSTVAVKLIRHLQTKVTTLQGAFERVEKLFAAIRRYQAEIEDNEEDEDDEKEIYQRVAPFVHGLATDIGAFVQKLKGTDYFGREQVERDDRRKFLENARSLSDMCGELRAEAAPANADDFDHRAVEEQVQIVKRYFLITVRLIFKNLVKVIVDTIEAARCDLILRSNLSYVAALSNVEYGGLASLNDAFIANYTTRALLLVCVESKFSSVRALALRALATVCSTTEAIRQLERADGLEVLRDILAVEGGAGGEERTEPELREAVSVLTQITAPWHGLEHRLEGLKQHVHALVEAITEIIERTTCCQTLLLCSASLNNMTRIEPTAVYSLMAQDTVSKLRTATEQRGPGTSIFLYEQFTSMLYNMSANWKSHHHLAGRPLLAFLVALFGQKFHEQLDSRTEAEAQRKTIRNILHVLQRLLAGGSLSTSTSLELLESTLVPVFTRIERTLEPASEYYRDIVSINRWFSERLAPQHGSGRGQAVVSPMAVTTPHITRLTVRRDPVNGAAVIMLDKNRQESYV